MWKSGKSSIGNGWMNAKQLGQATGRGMDSVAENVVVRFLARGAMILGTLVILPTGGWLLNRMVDTVDRLGASVNALTETQALASQNFDEMRGQYSDLKKQIDNQGAQLYLRSEAEKAEDWQKVRDAGQDADRQRVEKQVEDRLGGDEKRLLRLEDRH